MTTSGGSLGAIWVKRSREFRKEIIPYLGYMGQSGFSLFLSLIFISSALGYIKLIHGVSPDFPITLVGVAVMVPLLCWTPLRTWLTAADIVFHMPKEASMDTYLQRSFRRSRIITSVLGAILLLLYWPIYKQGPGLANGWMLIVFAILLRVGNSWGGWRERQLAWPNMRLVLRLLRWMATGLAWSVVLLRTPWQAALFIVLISCLFAMLYKLPSRHSFPWERLIQEEANTRRRYYLFFGLFIDVPTLPSRTASRKYMAWLLRLIPYHNRNTFVYLYTSSMIRTEMGGILIRLILLSALIVYWFAEAHWLEGWGAASVYMVFVLIVSVQLGGLRQIHSFSVWRHVYPMPDSQRTKSILLVDRWALIIVAVLIWLPAGLTLLLTGYSMPAAAALILILLYVFFIRPSRLKRKIISESDEE